MNDVLIAQDGSRIAYSIEGSGPILFLVGAPVGIQGFSQLASLLRDEFTVVLHDPRGIGLSTNNAAGQLFPEVLANDLASLIQRVAADNVLIFGASGGAVTAIELLCHQSSLVDFLVAHEPPLFKLLPDQNKTLNAANNAFAQAHDDIEAGLEAFANLTEIFHSTYADSPRPKPIKLPPLTPEESAKNRFFLTRMAGPTVNYSPQIEKLIEQPLCIAAGLASIGQPARNSSISLAALIRQSVVNAPGNHLAASTLPVEFSKWLKEILIH